MKNLKVMLFLLAVVMIAFSSCKKSDSSSSTPAPDAATAVAGSYKGKLTSMGVAIDATTTLTKVTETTATMSITMVGQTQPYGTVKIASGGTNVYNLTMDVSGVPFTGKVEGNKLTWSMTVDSMSQSFSGTK
jgi:biopolymer transport protein ExbD